MAALMKINDVAKKYGITKRTLRYYEEIGLLKTARVGTAQSRFFDATAINRLEQILLLRSVKFSINDISRVLLCDNTDTAFEFFVKRLKELDEKVNELNHCKAVISSFISIGKSVGINSINIYQLLREQIYIHGDDERMIKMEKSYEGDIIRLEFGMGIIPLINPNENGDFLTKIKDMRKKLETETSRDIPLIRITDNCELKELQYKISIKGNTLIDNNLSADPYENRAFEMISFLETAIRTNLDDIAGVK